MLTPTRAFGLSPAALGAARGGGGAHSTGPHLSYNVLEHSVDTPVALGRRLIVGYAPLVGEGLHRLAADFTVGAEISLGSNEDHRNVRRAGALNAAYLSA